MIVIGDFRRGLQWSWAFLLWHKGWMRNSDATNWWEHCWACTLHPSSPVRFSDRSPHPYGSREESEGYRTPTRKPPAHACSLNCWDYCLEKRMTGHQIWIHMPGTLPDFEISWCWWTSCMLSLIKHLVLKHFLRQSNLKRKHCFPSSFWRDGGMDSFILSTSGS